jgi:hypothetical protein
VVRQSSVEKRVGDNMEILVGAIIAFFALKFLAGNGGFSGNGIAGIPGSSSPGTVTLPTPVSGSVAAPIVTPSNTAVVQSNINSQETQTAAELTAFGAGLNTIPVVGPAVAAVYSAVAGALVAASKKRAQEAVNENQAVDAAIPPWDAAIVQTLGLYANGSITYAQLSQLLGTPKTDTYYQTGIGLCWNNYWSEVGPQVQPGRNGCKSGSVVATTSFCGGSYGAGCCIAYDDMDNSLYAIFQALQQSIAQPGVPITAKVLPIAASKYSTFSRGAYTVQVITP